MINQSQQRVFSLPILNHSHGVKAESDRLKKIRVPTRGSKQRSEIIKEKFESFLLLFEYLRSFSGVGFDKFKKEFPDQSDLLNRDLINS
jgi:hypothetical protein